MKIERNHIEKNYLKFFLLIKTNLFQNTLDCSYQGKTLNVPTAF